VKICVAGAPVSMKVTPEEDQVIENGGVVVFTVDIMDKSGNPTTESKASVSCTVRYSVCFIDNYAVSANFSIYPRVSRGYSENWRENGCRFLHHIICKLAVLFNARLTSSECQRKMADWQEVSLYCTDFHYPKACTYFSIPHRVVGWVKSVASYLLRLFAFPLSVTDVGMKQARSRVNLLVMTSISQRHNLIFILMIRVHSFPQAAEWRAESWNSFFSTEFWYFHGILQNFAKVEKWPITNKIVGLIAWLINKLRGKIKLNCLKLWALL